MPENISEPDLVLALQQLRSEVIQLKQKVATNARTLGQNSLYVGNNTVLTRLIDGHAIYVDARSVDIGFHLINDGRWEPGYVEFFRKLIKPNDTVFDIGANHGIYSLAAAKATGRNGRVFAFEANSHLAHLIQLSVFVNGYKDFVEIHNCGASNKPGEAEFNFDINFSGGGTLFVIGPRHKRANYLVKEKISLQKIDDILGDKIQTVDVIKMDVEGHEGCVLEGMCTILDRSPEVKIIMEWSKSMLDGSPVSASNTAAFFNARQFAAWKINAATGDLLPLDWATLAANRESVQNIYVTRRS